MTGSDSPRRSRPVFWKEVNNDVYTGRHTAPAFYTVPAVLDWSGYFPDGQGAIFAFVEPHHSFPEVGLDFGGRVCVCGLPGQIIG